MKLNSGVHSIVSLPKTCFTHSFKVQGQAPLEKPAYTGEQQHQHNCQLSKDQNVQLDQPLNSLQAAAPLTFTGSVGPPQP